MIIRQKTNWVIFHHALAEDCGVPEITGWHLARGFSTIGYHYVIRRSGVVENGRDKKYVGAHAKAFGRNRDSIGVCLEGNFNNTTISLAQVDTSIKLYHELSRAYSKNLKIGFHRSPSWLPNSCPGRRFDRRLFLERLLEAAPY